MNRLVALFLFVIVTTLETLTMSRMICGYATIIPDKPGNGDITGRITFIQNEPNGPVRVVGTVNGLTEGLHGFHVHNKGNMMDGCISTGPHFNPTQVSHGGPDSHERHVGDLGNINADKHGVASINFTDSVISLSGENSILGRSVVIHSDEDDYGLGDYPDSQTTGHSGSRVACGIIGLL